MALRLNDAVDHVRETLNVSAGDAAVYVKLCVAGPWKVSDLAEALEVHRNDVYRSLERLGARGLVETTLESPARYTAADPLKVLDLEIEARLAALEALKSSRQRTTDLVKALQCDAQGPQKTVYRILQGRQEISAARRKLIAGARHEVLALTTSPHAIAIAEFDGTLDAILAPGEERPEMRFLLNVPEETLLRAGLLPARPGLEVRHLPTDRAVHFLIVDGKEIVLSVVEDPSRSLYAPDDVALHTSAPGLLEAERVFFEQCWANAARYPGAPGERPAPAPDGPRVRTADAGRAL